MVRPEPKRRKQPFSCEGVDCKDLSHNGVAMHCLPPAALCEAGPWVSCEISRRDVLAMCEAQMAVAVAIGC